MACLGGIGEVVRMKESFRILKYHAEGKMPQPACLSDDWESIVGSVGPWNRVDAGTTWPTPVNSLDRAGFR
jgi:hypothetical protein